MFIFGLIVGILIGMIVLFLQGSWMMAKTYYNRTTRAYCKAAGYYLWCNTGVFRRKVIEPTIEEYMEKGA